MLPFIFVIETEEQYRTAEEIWNTYNRYMVRIASKILPNAEDAADAVMDATCNMVKNVHKFVDLGETDVVCLFTIYVKNAARRIYNKNKKRAGYVIDHDDYDMDDRKGSTEDVVMTRLEIEALGKHLHTISDIYSEPFMLRHYYGYSIPEIMKVLDITEANAKKRLYRAKQQLLELMEREHG